MQHPLKPLIYGIFPEEFLAFPYGLTRIEESYPKTRKEKGAPEKTENINKQHAKPDIGKVANMSMSPWIPFIVPTKNDEIPESCLVCKMSMTA